ncbi:YbaY family lipoprotein [Pseudomonas sp. N040]|uniref:YbaY family lipoprotein n=1 Tax=Pseudomonas sp. N040 TaxID=2785325 RepID=UPI0018A27F23|nr:YbaY family lipoprotein [Pseudomonas sp. N040]MBF7730899.1 YbaY family lipoprotein [Pseudomonas sp. N040]MBW7014542.1 YbaY family lipoprotein [Pseudomonas sp. N040]
MRLVPLILLSCLLPGCSSAPAPAAPMPAPAVATLAVAPPAAVTRFQLSGSLLTPPAGSVVELALLLVDAKGRPQALLASSTLTGTGQPLPFTLGFSHDTLPADLRPQLRARVSLSGQLVQRLPGQPLASLQSSHLGALQLVRAP